jgi:hypothetical protein
MKKLFLILSILFMSFFVKAQVFTPLDTTISGVRYKFFVHSISYSLNGDSLFTYRGVCEYKVNKKTFFMDYNGVIKGNLITVVTNQNQCRFEYTRAQLKAILKTDALLLIGETAAANMSAPK